MNIATPSLRVIQDDFQNYVLGGNKERPAIAAVIADQFGLPAAERLAIYYDAYRIRLSEALSEAFNKTHTYIGDQAFGGLCTAYIDQFPSRFRNLRWFGDGFSAFVLKSMPEYPIVAELAAFEWALGLAFDAADAPVLTAESIQQLNDDDWENIGFHLHPSLQLLPMHWNVPAIWLALDQEDAPPEALSIDVAATWLVWRKDMQAHFRSLTPYETLALQGLAHGRSFSSVCDAAAGLSEADITPQIAGWLHAWLTESVLTGINRDCAAE